MHSQRCSSQKSLITVRKWLMEAGDCPVPFSDENVPLKSQHKQPIKRKRLNNKIYRPKTTSMIDCFYDLLNRVFTIDHGNESQYDNASLSTFSCSICHSQPNQSSEETIEKIMVNTGTSSCDLNVSCSPVIHPSKATQTQSYLNEQLSPVYPLYCFSVKDGQLLPLTFSSSVINTEKISHKDHLNPAVLSCNNNIIYRSRSLLLPTAVISTTSCKSLKTLFDDDRSSKALSLYDTRVCHFDKRNCLIECRHSSNVDQKGLSESIFAQNTCQLIKQAWLSCALERK